jgi:hypothetical protein
MKENTMRTVLVTFVLVLSGAALAESTQSTPPAAGQQANAPASQKVIKDPAEYNAYMTALNTQDAAAKAQAMEAFIAQYPSSVVKMDALQQAMGAYQQSNNQAKVLDVANRILKEDPNDVRALAIVTFIEKNKASTPDDFAKVRQMGERGLNALPTAQKPEGIAAADWEKLKTQMKEIFAGSAGFAALQAKDFGAAKNYLQQSVQVDPNNLEDVYRLSLAYLESNPIDKTGLWYIARAYHLAQGNAKAQQQFASYGKSKYRHYHGSNDGWDQFLASVGGQTTPPADIPIAPAPSPQEVACNLIRDNDPKTLSIGDLEYVLQYRDSGAACNKDAATRAWQAVLDKQKDPKGDPAKLKINVKVISATPDAIEAAITDENQQSSKADLHVVMGKPITRLPAAGSMVDVIGTISDYTPSPFMFTMKDGEIPAAKPPARKPAVRRGAVGTHRKAG